MPEQDYIGEWMSWLDKGGGAKSAPAAPAKSGDKAIDKDYLSEWSAWLDKQPAPAPKPQGSIAQSVVSQIRDPKMFPGIPGVLAKFKGKADPMPSVGEVVGGIQGQAEQWGRLTGLPNPNDFEYDPNTMGMRKTATAPYRSVVAGVGPGGVPENGPGVMGAIQEQAKGLVDFIPDLLTDFVANPGKTLRERPVDILMVIESAAGPKLRARAKNAIAEYKRGVLTAEDIAQIAAEFGKEMAGKKQPFYTAKGPAVANGPGVEWRGAAGPQPAAPHVTGPEIPWRETMPTPAPAPAPIPEVAPAIPTPPPVPTPVPVAKPKRGPKKSATVPEAAPIAPLSVAAKEPWEMTRDEFGVPKAPMPDYTPAPNMRRRFGTSTPTPEGIDAFNKELAAFNKKRRTYSMASKEHVRLSNEHFYSVRRAVEEGRPVPPEVLAEYPGFERQVAETVPPAPLSITSGDMGLSLAEFEKARATGEQVTGYTGRKVPGLGMMMVDDKGRPITMQQFLAQKTGKNIQAAENLAVALGGRAVSPTEPPIPASPAVPLTAQQQLVEAAKAAQKLTPEQAAIYKQERGRRMGEFERTSVGMSGEAKAMARLRAQSGQMERVGWEPIRDKFTPEAIDGFHDMIDRETRLTEFEKMPATTGLNKLLSGELPQPAEIQKLELVFGKDLADTLIARRDTMSKAMRFLLEAGNLPRSMMASFDLSAPLRQGVFMVSHPKQFVPAFGEMFKDFFSEKNYAALQNSITQRPTFKLMQDAKLGITDATRFISSREERFASSIADRIPIVGKGVRASERAYVGFLNKLRADTFDSLVKLTEQKGMNPYENPGLTRQIADLVNNMTGRGSLKSVGLDRAANMANALFFSPRLMASRVAMLNPATYAKLPKNVRSWAVKTAIADAGIGVTVLGLLKAGGAEVNLDFASPDFGKAKFGNTRIDFWGGFSQYARTLLQIGDGLRKQYLTGEKPDRNPLEALSTFVQYKEAPAVSFLADMMRGKNMIGEKFNPAAEVGKRLIPMMIQDMDDIIKNDPSQLGLIAPGIFGVGVQTYEDKPKKKASLW